MQTRVVLARGKYHTFLIRAGEGIAAFMRLKRLVLCGKSGQMERAGARDEGLLYGKVKGALSKGAWECGLPR